MAKFGIKVAAVVAVSAAFFTACSTPATPAASGSEAASSAPGAKTYKIGVTFPILDQFLQKVADGITAEAKAKGADVTIVAADEKTDVQVGQVENFISQKVDAIIVIPVDTDAAGTMTQKAQDAKIPLVYVNRKPSDIPETVPYVGSDSLVSGTLEMTQLATLAGGKGNVVVLQGDPANEAAVLRTKGCVDVVAKNPGMKITKTATGMWQREKGQSVMENWLQSGEEINVVCANNDEMALGAINAIKAAKKTLGKDGILVGGVDATSDALAALKAGDLATTVFQDAKGQGGGGVDAALTLISGGTVPAYVDVPYQLVTLENMADFAGK
ncbi:MAG TPA: sugar ABC transporter substrate-binding protein [Propionicimonas sp.]|jgi:inositol transport system substrate-binding protein|uniref:sugar ABC transporter substrate-binding protein n=1 Tax=Propionicimonas sp. TaxID=1955623 RepID=UPI002F42B177